MEELNMETSNQVVRKELTDADMIALQTMLGNMTLTKSGMIRVMAYLVLNKELAEDFSDLVFATEQIAKNTENISKELELIRKQLLNVAKLV